MIFMTLVIISCKKQNKVLTEINTAAVTEKKQDVQAVEKENECSCYFNRPTGIFLQIGS